MDSVSTIAISLHFEVFNEGIVSRQERISLQKQPYSVDIIGPLVLNI